jgi:hypothetical protein
MPEIVILPEIASIQALGFGEKRGNLSGCKKPQIDPGK